MDKDFKLKLISEGINNGVSSTCKKYNISRTLYYRWLARYKSNGIEGLDKIKKDFVPISKTNIAIESSLLELIKQYPTYGPKYLKYTFDELGHNISESAVYNIMKRNNLTKKENRIKFAKKQEKQLTTTLPALSTLNSGECWLFWVTDYGTHENIGRIYEYTLYDFKSRITCSRLYNEINFTNFEDILTSTAMPIAKTLNLKVNYLCLFENDKILNHSKMSFNSNINKIISDNGFDFKIYTLLDTNVDLNISNELRQNYTEGCLSFLIPLINANLSFRKLRFKFQSYVRNYNMIAKSKIGDQEFTPVEYHNKITDNKVILPIFAYINREY
ncbi:MAG: helix-turn-helix domain-containing protein [Sarcina sp.]